MSVSTCCGHSLSLSPSQPVLSSQSVSIHQFSRLLPEKEWTYHSGRGRDGEQQGNTIAARLRAGLGPWLDPSTDSSGKAAWIDEAQDLGSPRDPYPYSLPWKPPDVLGSRVMVRTGRVLVGCHRKSQVLSSILSLASSSIFPLILATFCPGPLG